MTWSRKVSRAREILGWLSALAMLAPVGAMADTAGLIAEAPKCDNRNGGVDAAERLRACSAMLAMGGLTAQQESQVRVNRGWSFSLLGRMSEARGDYVRAVELDPSSYVAFNEFALFNLKLGDLDAALVDYVTALRLKPGLPYSLYGLGIVHIRKGDVKLGEDELAQARAADSNIDSVFRSIGVHP